MGGFGQCVESRVRQLWHYNTTFGSLGFNVLAIQLNVLELVVTAVLLGIWHSSLTIEYIWWPAFECVRVFVLTLCRADVLLKDVNDIRVNSRASAQTRRIIMLCNLVGAASILIGAPIYLLLIPQTSDALYWTFIVTFLVLVAMRICLTIPMFATLIYGTSMYRIVDGNDYERIDDPTDRQQHATDPLLDSDTDPQDGDRPEYNVPADVLAVLQEEHQLSRALEASRRETANQRDRRLREQQDREYQEALEQQKRLDEAQSAPQILQGNESHTYQGRVSSGSGSDENSLDELVASGDGVNGATKHATNYNSYDNSSGNDNHHAIDIDGNAMATRQQAPQEDELAIEQEKEEVIEALTSALPALGEEPSKSDWTVSVRVRLPNGTRCMRRFEHKANIGDIGNWVNHELVKNESAEIINEFVLVTTMPRAVYKDETKTMEDLKFWRKNSKRECHTPLLYVEESLIDDQDSCDSDSDRDDSSSE